MGIVSWIGATVVGERIELPAEMISRYPDLKGATYRRGGLPVRIGGWALGASTAEAITLWRTIYLARNAEPTAALLLHELRHVHQFLESWTFPFSYLWQSIRHGYSRNAYEVEARRYSALRLGTPDKDL